MKVDEWKGIEHPALRGLRSEGKGFGFHGTSGRSLKMGSVKAA